MKRKYNGTSFTKDFEDAYDKPVEYIAPGSVIIGKDPYGEPIYGLYESKEEQNAKQ